LGLMAAVTVQLAQTAFVDILSVALGVVAAILLMRFKINSTWWCWAGRLPACSARRCVDEGKPRGRAQPRGRGWGAAN